MKRHLLLAVLAAVLTATSYWVSTAGRSASVAGSVAPPDRATATANRSWVPPSAQTTPAPATPGISAAAAPTIAFDSGSAAFDRLPSGVFKRDLAKLDTAARTHALRQLADLAVPANDVASLRVGRSGGLYYECALPSTEVLTAAAQAGKERAEKAAPHTATAAVPVASPPVHHSRSGAPNVIYLDFNGHTIAGTAWNVDNGVASYVAKPFDTDGDPTTFSDYEQFAINSIWERVAEDFRPFNVDVTTELPASFTARTGRVVVTASVDANGVAMPSATASGVAYLDVFGDGDYVTAHSPALVYADRLFSYPDSIADAAAHEMGHNLGLSHDGTSTQEYYAGHYGSDYNVASWGPIMGAPFGMSVTQWSKGEYYNSNNTQDDLAIIAAKLNLLGDDHGDTNGTATALTVQGDNLAGEGVITSATDGDRFSFTVPTTAASIQVLPSLAYSYYTAGADLDAKLQLYNSSNTLIASSDVAAQGLSAQLVQGLNSGTYYVRVSGSGAGTPTVNPPSGYTSYGSVGKYALTLAQSPAVAPYFYSVPQRTSVYAGENAGFSVAVGGNPASTVRWQRMPAGSGTWANLSDGGNYSGTATTFLQVVTTAPMNGDQFRCVATNFLGSVTSAEAMLVVQPAVAPAVYNLPSALTPLYGESIYLGPQISGSPPLTYQWKKNGVALPGFTAASLYIYQLTQADNGSYTVTVTNPTGSVTSSACVIAVNAPLLPVVQMPNSTLTVPLGQYWSINPYIIGSQPMTYEWRKDGVVLGGQTTATLNLSTAQASDAGQYSLTVTNAAGATTGTAVNVTVSPPVAPSFPTPPSTVVVNYGDSLNLSVYPGGSQPMTFQWYKDGVALNGQTSSSYYKSGGVPADSGVYTVTATNAAGSATSGAITVQVAGPVAPTISGLPSSVDYSYGASISFYASVSGTQPISFQWRKDGALVAGATASSFSTNNASPLDNGVYTLTATNAVGTTTSSTVTVTVGPPVAPSIHSLPGAVTVAYGGTLVLSPLVLGTSPMTYQWYKDGVPVSGQNSMTFYRPGATVADSGIYTVTAANTAGSATSASVTVTVLAAVSPAITGIPSFGTLAYGEALSINPTYSGSEPMTYQWRKGGVAIATATSSSFYKSGMTPADAGVYTVIATNAAGSTTSTSLTLSVSAAVAPAIGGLPASLNLAYGANLSLSPAVTGTQPISFQWRKGGVDIPGAVQSSFGIGNITNADAATYTLAATNVAGTTSVNVVLTVAAAIAPSVTDLPASLAVNYGDNIFLSTTVTGSQPLTMQWKKNGVAIANATASSFGKQSATAADSGTYTITVTNVAGSFTSSGVVVTVAPAIAPTFIQQPVSISVLAGNGARFRAVATGSPQLTYQWYHGSQPVPGGTTQEISFSSVTAADAGDYHAVVTNDGGSASSASASLTVVPPSGGVAVSAGAGDTLVIKSGGVLWSVGNGTYGQLANGSQGVVTQFTGVASGVVSALAGYEATWFIKSDATLWAVGHNLSGRLGTGASTDVTAPVQIATDTVAVAAGYYHSLVLKRDGSVWGAGGNAYGQLGLAGSNDRTSLTLIAQDVIGVAAGNYHSLLLKRDGTVWAMGANASGQLGDATNTDRNTPVLVASGITSIAANGSQSYAVDANGTLWSWGSNGYGALGDGTFGSHNAPTPIVGGVASVAAGSDHTAYVTQDGALWTMGVNYSGQLGDGSSTVRPSPTLIVASGVASAAAGSDHTVFVKTDGSVWGTGGNSVSQLASYGYSFLAPIQIADGPIAVPTAPSDVVATDNTLAATIRISWLPSLNATSYEIWRGTFASLASATRVGVSRQGLYFDNSALPDVVYYYWIKAVNPAGISGATQPAQGRTSAPSVPVFTLQPTGQSVAAGSAVTFTAMAVGVPTPAYQWRKDGVELAGETFAALTIDPVHRSAAGTYTVVATNSAGATVSQGAVLAVTSNLASDFNGDGAPDILLENSSSGQRVLWLMGGPNSEYVAQGLDLGFLDAAWHIASVDDFNGDGAPDILLENISSGQRVLWIMGGLNNQFVVQGLDLGFLDPAWHIAGTADFNGDGGPDILLENTVSGQRVLWLMGGPNNQYVTQGLDLGFLDAAWHIVGAADFSGDGGPDLLLENTSSGQRVLWIMGGPNHQFVVQGLDLGFLDSAWRIVALADFNRDGGPDVLLENGSSGQRVLWLMGGPNNQYVLQALDLGFLAPSWHIAN